MWWVAERRELADLWRPERVLEGTAPPAELLHHAVRADDRPATYAHGITAGQAAVHIFAAREAIGHFTRAFAIDDAPVAAHLDLARAFELVEDARAAEDVYHQLHQHAVAAGNQLLAARALVSWAVLEAQAMRLDRALQLVADATTAARASRDPRTEVEAALGNALIHTYATDLDTALAEAHTAVALARATRSIELVARGLNAVAFTRQLRGDWNTIEAPAAEAAQLFGELGDLAMQEDSRCYIAASRIALGDHSVGIGLAREALMASRAIENAWGIAHSAFHLAWGLIDAGRYAELEDVVALGIESARSIRFAPLLCLNLVVAGAAKRVMFDLPRALELHKQALHLGRQLGGLSRELAAGEQCADLVELGDSAAAVDAALEARTARTRARMFTDLSRPAQTEALLRGGHTDEAPQSLPGDRYRIPILRTRSKMAMAAGDSGGAIQHLDAAAQIAARLGLPGEEWIICRDLARAHQRVDSTSAARTQQARARDILGTLAQDLPSSGAEGLLRAQVDVLRECEAAE